MTAVLGDCALAAAVLAAAGAVFAAACGARFDAPGALRVAQRLMAGFTLLITLCCAVLLLALLRSDFRLAYVVSYTERALPWGYKLAALWAGQEGSLLLWAWLLALLSLIAIVQRRREHGAESAAVIATLALACGFFAALMLFAADPFRQLAEPAADGHGLNPLLQDPAMIAHPPLLFVGYAGFTIPFALVAGALAAGRRDDRWTAAMRPWLLVSWLFLGAGIVLGAQWAYIELGWGGYWAWDPVENASLLPWLTATALLHSIMAQQQRGMFRFWNVSLTAATFLLCIFGTYLTRSGVVQSVHAFAPSLVGTFFLAFLLICLAGVVALLIWRRRLLADDERLAHLVSKEGALLATNVLLVLMTLVTVVGTVFPVLSKWVGAEPISVGPTFYNHVVVPLALALLALMTLGPLLAYGPDGAQRLRRGLIIPGVAAALVAAALYLLGFVSPWALACGAIAALGLCTIAADVVAALSRRRRQTGEPVLVALLRLLDADHRRYGGRLAHVGVLMLMAGVAGSSLYGVDEKLQLTSGQHVEVAGHHVHYTGLRQVRDVNFTAYEASVTVADPGGRSRTLRPQKRFYDKDKSGQPNSEVALTWSLIRDVYVTLAGWEDGGERVAIQVLINPLVAWIWIGGTVITLAGLLSVLPPLLPGLEAARAASGARDVPIPPADRVVETEAQP